MTDTETEEAAREPCPNCGKVHEGDRSPEMEALIARVDELDAERKLVLLDKALMVIREGLIELGQRSTDGYQTEGLYTLLNLTTLAGYTAAGVSVDLDFSVTGDKRVDTLLADYLEELESQIDNSRINADDLPDGVVDRLKAGTATPEDFEAVREVVKERIGADPGDLTHDPRLKPPDNVGDHYVEPPDLRYL